MSDDNFFNKSINDESDTGFITSLVAAGDLSPGPNYIAGTGVANFIAKLPPATVGAGTKVAVTVASTTKTVTLTPAGTDQINSGGAGVGVVAAIRNYTFVSDGVANWIYTA